VKLQKATVRTRQRISAGLSHTEARARHTQVAYVDWRYSRAISGGSLSKAQYCLTEPCDIQRSLIHAAIE
jgi:hypothetical protein